MPNLCFHLLVTALLVSAVTTAKADGITGKTIVVAVDLSPQNRSLSDPGFNSTISDMVLADVAEMNLNYGDKARLRAFGQPGGDLRPLPDWHADITFVYDSFGGKDPRQLGPYLSARIAQLVGVVPSGPTDLHYSLSRLAEELDCQASETQVVLVANMVEAGQFIDGKYYLAQLPPDIFAGCASITIAGFDGAFVSGSAAAQMVAENAWRETLMAAGFHDVRFIR
jgi:hypothetical protein